MVMNARILLFDPDPVAGDKLAMQLRHAGFATQVTSDGSTATSTASGKRFSSIVVIANLADSQMRQCLHHIRDADPEAWLIVIADPTLKRCAQVIRELGADAAMDVPFTVLELAQRLSSRPARTRAGP
jgi:DNA-binding response OmpR family regulator